MFSSSMSDYDILVRVSLLNQVYEVNVKEQLHISPGNLLQELLDQPLKYGWWSTLNKLSALKIDSIQRALDSCVPGTPEHILHLSEYEAALNQAQLTSGMVDALEHRKVALLQLCSSHRRRDVLKEYRFKLSELTALRA